MPLTFQSRCSLRTCILIDLGDWGPLRIPTDRISYEKQNLQVPRFHWQRAAVEEENIARCRKLYSR